MREKNQATILYFTEYLLLFNLSWASTHDIEDPVKNTSHESFQRLHSDVSFDLFDQSLVDKLFEMLTIQLWYQISIDKYLRNWGIIS